MPTVGRFSDPFYYKDRKDMTKRKTLLKLACLLIPLLTCFGQILIRDQPIKGEWHFSPEKIWEVEKAGDTDFGRIAELLVSEKENIILRDFERNVSYVFNSGGRFIKAFAAQGVGEGLLPFYLNRFQAVDKIVLAAPDKLHFFTQDGVFVRAVENNLFLHFPLRFINENEFIYAPNFTQSPVHQKKLAVFDLSSGQERIFVDFTEPEGREQKPAPLPMLMINSLIPQVQLDDDGETLFFGRSDSYTIYAADRSGNIQTSFSLERKKLIASPEGKRAHLADSRMPKEAIEKILTLLPDDMTYFSHIQAIRGLIYVFAVTAMEKETADQAVDIFSPKGEFLYRASLRFGDLVKFGSPSNLIIKGEIVYIILKSEQGKQTLAKFRIKLPR
jgi:hypothetical protein